jgi:hypothetical protein
VVRRALVVSAVLALAVIPAGARAPAAVRPPTAYVRVTPATGYANTTFVLSFRVSERTGGYGSSQRHDVLTASAPASARGCISTLYVRVPDASAGAHIRVTLAPRRLGGRWCKGVYHGRIEELETALCPRGALCPTYVLVRGIVGRFALKVRDVSPAGVTSYRTPGLPSHGTFYFVVRARDSAGNQDRNVVEQRGVDPCY